MDNILSDILISDQKLEMTERYHVYVGDKRTTISFSSILAVLIAITGDLTPNTKEAHTYVRETLQGFLNEYPDTGRVHVSQWLEGEAILSLVDNKLSERYLDCLLESKTRPYKTASFYK